VKSVENQVLFEWITMSTPLRPRPRHRGGKGLIINDILDLARPGSDSDSKESMTYKRNLEKATPGNH